MTESAISTGDAYARAVQAFAEGGCCTRPAKRPDGVPTRIDRNFHSPAELAIVEAMAAVEAAGASLALTDAITLLSLARDRVADHVEGAGDQARASS